MDWMLVPPTVEWLVLPPQHDDARTRASGERLGSGEATRVQTVTRRGLCSQRAVLYVLSPLLGGGVVLGTLFDFPVLQFPYLDQDKQYHLPHSVDMKSK